MNATRTINDEQLTAMDVVVHDGCSLRGCVSSANFFFFDGGADEAKTCCPMQDVGPTSDGWFDVKERCTSENSICFCYKPT